MQSSYGEFFSFLHFLLEYNFCIFVFFLKTFLKRKSPWMKCNAVFSWRIILWFFAFSYGILFLYFFSKLFLKRNSPWMKCNAVISWRIILFSGAKAAALAAQAKMQPVQKRWRISQQRSELYFECLDFHIHIQQSFFAEKGRNSEKACSEFFLQFILSMYIQQIYINNIYKIVLVGSFASINEII